MQKYLESTALLDFESSIIQNLIIERKWREKSGFEKILEIYNFVRDEVPFGYNSTDAITASKVIKDGYGQCNTKGILFMALIRGVGVACRFHGFTIDKKLQRGAMTGIVYKFAPNNIVHSWVEVLFEDKWFNMEGFILDKKYLLKLQRKFSDCKGSFCGYGVAVEDFSNPVIDWNKNDTYIQKDGINNDLGVFDSPDEFFKKYRQSLNVIKGFVFKNIGRHLMNRNVKKIRENS